MYSVVIPYFNHGLYLPELLHCLENQFRHIGEIIFVDDGSTTGDLYARLKNYKGPLKSKIEYIHKINGGTHSALNLGIVRASHEHIAILNSDDLFDAYRLERCDDLLHDHQADLIFGKVTFIDTNGGAYPAPMRHEWYNIGLDAVSNYEFFPALLIQENIAVTTSNFTFKRSLFNTLGGFRPFRYANDLDFLIRATLNSPYHFDQEEVHTNYRLHDSNTISESADLTTHEVSCIARDLRSQFHEKGSSAYREYLKACEIRGLNV